MRAYPPIAVLALSLIALAPSVHAQQPAPDSSGRARDSIALRTVVVTATRAAAELPQVPYAVTTIEGAPRSHGVTLEEALEGVPGVQVDNRSNFAVGDRLAVRGIGARSQFGVRGVKVLVDGVPMTFADGQSALEGIDPRFVRRVEVLRGAASMLYGNAAGGAILMSTEGTPRTRSTTIGASAVADGGPISMHGSIDRTVRSASIRFLTSQMIYDGWREHSEARLWRNVLGATLAPGALDTLRLRFGFTALEADNPGSLARARLDSAPRAAHGANVEQETGKDLSQLELGAAWRREGATTLDAAAWTIVRTVTNPIIGRTIELDRVAAGARLAVGSGRGGSLRWTAGVDLDAQLDERRNLSNAEPDRVLLDQSEQVLSAGPFAIATLALTPELSLTGALRGDVVAFSVDDRLVDSTDADDSDAHTMSALSPSLGLAWSLTGSATFFANVATGFETPTTTELANRPSGAGGFNGDLAPQRSLSIELGARLRGPLGTALELVGYHMTVTDELIPFEIESAPGRSYYRNAGSATHRGVELDAAVRPLDSLALRATLSYTDARFDEFAIGDRRFDGNRIPGVAPLQAAVGLDWRVAGFALGLDARHQAATPVDDASSAEADPFTLLSARLEYDGLSVAIGGSRLRISPWVLVENILDVRHAASVVPNAAGGRFYEPGRERSFGGGLELELR